LRDGLFSMLPFPHYAAPAQGIIAAGGMKKQEGDEPFLFITKPLIIERLHILFMFRQLPEPT